MRDQRSEKIEIEVEVENRYRYRNKKARYFFPPRSPEKKFEIFLLKKIKKGIYILYISYLVSKHVGKREGKGERERGREGEGFASKE